VSAPTAPLTIEGDEAETIKKLPDGRKGTATDDLLAGKVLWYPGRTQGQVAAMFAGRLKMAGKKPVTRTAERDGVKGVYMWAVEVAP
jgi:hypothetical protein